MSEREAGPALDALVAERVMGLEVAWFDSARDLIWLEEVDAFVQRDAGVARLAGTRYALPFSRDLHIVGRWLRVVAYSTTGDGMLLVIERMRALGWWWELAKATDGAAVEAVFSLGATYWHRSADTLPHAVALAALAALEGRG